MYAVALFSCRLESGRMSAVSSNLVFVIGLSLALTVGGGSWLAAEEVRPPDDRLNRMLAAGEFGPARELARQALDAQQRDAWLRQVADSQVRAGARRAAVHTAMEIGNEQIRSRTLDGFGRPPSGGGRGGAAMADFDTLIELITSTVAPDTWDEVGGPGAIESFPTGVLVDSSGLLGASPPSMRPISPICGQLPLAAARNLDARKPSPLRKVSLTRLERQLQRLWALGEETDEALRTLAGLRRVQYVLVYPETRDVVIAGPAGNWTWDAEGRVVGADDSRPVLQLDDLVVVLRNAYSDQPGRFGCSITPRQENLAAVQDFLRESAQRSLKPSERDRWLTTLRQRLGRQDIQVHGIDPRSRAARTIVEADYHMKLIGMGLEAGTLGVTSYLDSVQLGADGSPPAMDVLRWWFTLDYESLPATPHRNAFELRGPGVKVLSENELLAERGRCEHTGTSEEKNLQFAQSFTRHFNELAVKYPVYAELRNLFDLALVAALIRSENLAKQCDWQLSFFVDDGKYQVDRGIAPREVESVVNYRVIDRRHLIAGVSGGVTVDTGPFVRADRVQEDDYGLLKAERADAAPRNPQPDAWWWD